jgi:hypothetical protein
MIRRNEANSAAASYATATGYRTCYCCASCYPTEPSGFNGNVYLVNDYITVVITQNIKYETHCISGTWTYRNTDTVFMLES